MTTDFSKNGKYFVQLHEQKLNVWNTSENKLEKTFTPNLTHKINCVSVCIIETNRALSKNNVSPNKRTKRRNSVSEQIFYYITLGTDSGLLLVYSISDGTEFSIDSSTKMSVNCLSWQNDADVYAGIEETILCWDLFKHDVKCKWKSGNVKINAILKVPNTDTLLTASKGITLWDVKSKSVVRKFKGHNYDVPILKYIEDDYFMSTSKGDRWLTCWRLDGSIKVHTELMIEDIAMQVNVTVDDEGVTNFATLTRSGMCHVHQISFDKPFKKSVKPKTTIQVVSDNSNYKESVKPIDIISLSFSEESLILAYGNPENLVFEEVSLNSYEKVQCLVRKDPTVFRKEKQMTNGEVSLKCRLSDLQNKNDKNPITNEISTLLLKALQVDKKLFKEVLSNRDDGEIRNVLKKLPNDLIINLVDELVKFINEKTVLSQIATIWLRNVLQIHPSVVSTHPNLNNISALVENKLVLHAAVSKVNGRLDLLMAQINLSSQTDTDVVIASFNDTDFSDSDIEGMDIPINSGSESEWHEESDEDDEMNLEDL